MWKQIKTFVEPLERFITTSSVKKTSLSHTSCTSQLSKSIKHVSEPQKQFTSSAFVNRVEKSKLLRFLQDTFPLLKSLTPLEIPAPVTSTQISLHFYKSQRSCFLHSYGLMQPAGARNVFNGGIRNFSTVQTTMINNCAGNGSAILAQLGFKPFSAFATKTGSLWAQQFQMNNVDHVKKNRPTDLKIMDQKKVFTESKGIIEAIQKKNIINENKQNMTRIVCRSNITNSPKKSEAATEIMDDNAIVTSDNAQIYMSFVLISSLFLDPRFNSITDSITNNSHQMNQLNPSFIQNLGKFAEMQHRHMVEIISILTLLLKHEKYELELFGYELRVYFPPEMSISDVKNLLQTLGINSESPYFKLKEMMNLALSIALSNSTDETDINLSDSFLINSFSSPCMTPPRLKQEYIHEINEFLALVDSLITEKDSFGKKVRNEQNSM
ncbi:196_t:CDS:1 [Dentiscutata erythropus]|uniref:196_t:CDS:1 n=1 Tax=Dentiscutata erythropus TaxID=1348616 RepID=A0A9N8VMU9_9GLOM|nr:196_t:CDS:1 [Dentiscutata erythropus]